ncbi:MAG: acyclic terpene utilization AtuA family protein [Haloferacaceae archaeon]
MDECVTLSPLGILGYGIPEDSIRRAKEEYEIDVIAVDAGSVDPGPNYLGMGESFTDHDMVKRDLEILLDARADLDVPLLVGTAGGAGAEPHLNWLDGILTDLLREGDRSLAVARIYTDVDREYLRAKRDAGEVSELDHHVALTDERLAETSTMVAQIGHEPYVEALSAGADVVLGGRSSDLAPFSAVPLQEGFDRGLTAHMAKILECGAHATEAGTGADGLIGILGEDRFEVVPPNPEKRCTVESVSAHTLYEKANPHRIHLPGGHVDVSAATFEQVADRRVRVAGSRFHATEPRAVLVEGVRRRGYRTITVAGIRDPTTLDHLDDLVAGTTARVAEFFDDRADEYDLAVRTYGVDAVPLYEVDRGETPETPPEVGVVIDALASTQEFADTVCSMARSTLLHHPFEGRTATGGNLAFPYSPSDVSVGEVYEFSVHHLVEDVAPSRLATVETEVLP